MNTWIFIPVTQLSYQYVGKHSPSHVTWDRIREYENYPSAVIIHNHLTTLCFFYATGNIGVNNTINFPITPHQQLISTLNNESSYWATSSSKLPVACHWAPTCRACSRFVIWQQRTVLLSCDNALNYAMPPGIFTYECCALDIEFEFKKCPERINHLHFVCELGTPANMIKMKRFILKKSWTCRC